MWKSKFGKANGMAQKDVNGSSAAKIYVGEAKPPATPPQAESKAASQNRKSTDLQDWQLDSTYDSKNLTTTRDLDDFTSSLSVRPERPPSLGQCKRTCMIGDAT